MIKNNEKARFFAFFVGLVLFGLASNFAHPVTPTIIQDLHLHDYMFGVALGVMMVTNFLMSPFWGRINSYIPARLELLICCSGYGLAQLWFAASKTELSIIGARMVAGLFVGGIMVAFLAYVVNTAKPEDQGKYLTISATVQAVASAFGYMVGGFLGEISVKLAFYVQAATLIGIGIFFYLVMIPDNRHTVKEISGKQLVRESNPFRAFMDCGKFMTLYFAMLFAVNILVNFGNTSFDQAFNYYLKAQLGLTSSYNGLIKAAVGFITLIANSTLCIWIINKTKVSRSMLILILVCVAAAIGTLISLNVAVFIGFAVFLYAAYSVSLPVMQSLIAQAADPEQKSYVMSFYNATKSLGSMIGSLTVGFIYSVSVKLPFLVTAVFFGLAAVAAFAMMQINKNR